MVPTGSSGEDAPVDFIDLALDQGPSKELAALRARLAGDPLAALEFAETRQMLERLRGLRIEPGERLAGRLDAVVRQCARREALRRPTQWTWGRLLAGASAAAALFVGLAAVDPLGLRRPVRIDACAAPAPVAHREVESAFRVVPEPMTATMALAYEATQRLAPRSPLTDAWSRFQDAGSRDRFAQWLSPRNAVALLKLDQEMRASASARLALLQARGHFGGIDDRVQQLGRGLAADLLADRGDDIRAVAAAVRALLAAGGVEVAALEHGGQRLAAALPTLSGGDLAAALVALGELGIATGHYADVLADQGRRLVREIVAVEGETWVRRRPWFLSSAAPAGALAEAGRFLQVAPAFGLDTDEAGLVRLLLAAHLRERRDPHSDTPDVLAALVYGFDDLLGDDERDNVELRLRTWRPSSLVPDYGTLHQLAATRAPERRGYARFQLDLRRVAAATTPPDMAARAALCLCLSTCFGGPTIALAQG